jgi:hypothetical protein
VEPLGSGGRLAPVRWLADGRTLVVEDVLAGRGGLYDADTGELHPLPIADEPYHLPYTPEGVSPDGRLVLFTAPAGEALLDRATSTVHALGGDPSAHDTGWLALAPDLVHAAVVRIRPGQDNRAGGGQLEIHDGRGTQPTVVSPGDALDHAPAWADGGARLAFLRTDVAAWGAHPGPGSEWALAGVMVHVCGTGVTSTVLPPDAARRTLVVPASGDVAVFLERDGDRGRARSVALSDGRALTLLDDSTDHTAIGWAQP